LGQSGCAFLGGAATGALVTGAGYEYQAKRQMDQLEDDFRKERISRKEYESRKKQIEAGSIIY
jgi:Tfp pilus assembly protein PilO